MTQQIPAFVWPIVGLVVLVAFAALYKLWLRLFGVVMIPQDSIGIVNKKFVLAGVNKSLPDGSLVALNGEAGIQADTLAPGVHYGYWPWQFEVHIEKFMTIPQGKLGIVEARDGAPLDGGHVLGRQVVCDSFQNARAFLQGPKRGNRGPQLAIIPPGTYRINAALFSVTITDILEVPANQVGIVTTKDGAALPAGDIAGSEVPGHNSFQDPQTFIDAGGTKGLQEQVILSGRYFINPLFATVTLQDMTPVPIATVGVVIAYVGREGHDVTGDSFRHGNLVTKGEKGVWAEPLDPGKYPINPFTHKVEIVPTANVVLNWATGKSEAHKLDEKLSTITVRSSDGFTFNLDVSQIIHVPRTEAPKVIARFGSMANLVTQVLEPTIGNYFRNAAQGSDAIEFLKSRVERQKQARDSINAALSDYNVGAVDTLIGDINPPAALMKTLTDRKLAEQEKVTYNTQRLAEETRKELAQATAMADTQPSVVAAERSVNIAEFAATASVKTAEGASKAAIAAATGQAEAKRLNADADANVITLTGAATAGKTLAIGNAEAEVTKAKIASMEAGNYAMIETAKALAASGFKLVPDVVASGTGSGSGGSLVDVILAQLVTRKGA